MSLEWSAALCCREQTQPQGPDHSDAPVPRNWLPYLPRSAAPSHTARPVAHIPMEEEEAEAKLCWSPSKGEIFNLPEGRTHRKVAQNRHWPLSPVPHQRNFENLGQCPCCPQVPFFLYPYDPFSLLLYITFLLCFSQFGASIVWPGTWQCKAVSHTMFFFW